MAKTAYEEIKEQNQLLEHQFRIYGGVEEEDSIELLDPGKTISGKPSAETARKINLAKKNICTTEVPHNAGSLVNHRLDVVNRNGEYETTIWTTTPENIQKALRSGLCLYDLLSMTQTILRI